MAQDEIGRIEEVSIREVWPDEANDFTPWLAENLGVLGETLGMEIELGGTEVSVGNYYLDILAREPNRDAVVAIENQLAVTDNPHLGQLLTYTAGTKANIVIWIATEFRDEHRAALTYLNDSTGESLAFFGIEVGAIRIGNSQPAPLFRLAVTPNLWSKQKVSVSSALTERQAQYVEFWRPFLERLNSEHGWNVGTENRYAAYQSGSGMGDGRFGRHMRITSEGEARVEWVIQARNAEWNKAVFDLLERSREQIEREVGPTTWERLDSAQMSRVVLSRRGSIDAPAAELEEMRSWMIAKCTKLPETFRPHIEAILSELDLSSAC